jgi:hypothetical protein
MKHTLAILAAGKVGKSAAVDVYKVVKYVVS